MAGQLGHIAATASLDINPFQQSSRVLQTQIKTIDKALKAQELSFKNNSKNISGMKVAYDQTGKSIQSHTALLQQQEKKYNDLKDEIGDINKANANQKTSLLNAEAAMTTTSGKIEELTGKYNNLGKQIAIQESSWTKAGNTLEVIGKKATSVGTNLTSIGNSMTKGLTVPIVGGVALAVKSAIDFESAFAGVKKTVDEVVDTNGNVIISYEDLSAGIREMAKELPASATQISEVAESAGQLGIQTENVLSFSKTMIDMGESTNLGANEAATALAKFANITGMSQDQFSNLGASIVDLGNNFATTESDIVEMAMRLAGAGAQVGLSEADILGLSAALSSVGIEAEMGGSAISKVMVNMAVATKTGLDAVKDLETATGMSRRELELMASLDSKGFKGFKDIAGTLNMTTTEMNKIIKSGKNLEGFSAIAGMTGEQFKKAFEEDAVGALGAFIEGLGTAEEKGTSAIELLDEMGISEVRLRDSLLRAGNASELFAGAVQMSNEAYEENTALTDEANKRYETTESKLKMLKNQVNDVAIEFGGPFVDALRDGLEAATPLIENLGNLANAFSEASPEMQQTIVKTLAFTAAAGPMLKILGKVFTVSGSGIDTISKVSKKIGEMSGTAKASKLALDASSTGMIGATGSAAKLTAGLGAIAPALLIVGGVLAAGTIAWKLWGEDAYEASERTKKWGSDVGEEADKALTNFQTLSSEAGQATNLMAFNIEEGTGRAIEAYNGMSQSIIEDVQETISETEENLASLPESVREIVAESMTEGVAEQTKLVAEVEEIQSAITGIYETALAENREISDNELTIIENYHQRLAEIRSETLELSAEEQRNVQAVMAEDLKSFSQEQLRQRIVMLDEENRAIKSKYAEQAEWLEGEYIAGRIDSEQEYNKAMAALRQEELDDLMVVGAEYMKVWEEQGNVPEEIQRKILNDLGVSYEEVQQYMALHNEKISEANNIMIKSSEDASAKVKEANEAWNSMELLDKEGNLKTNVKEVIQEASQSEEGWEQLQFIMHNAELDTNAMEIIKDALMAEGKWWQIDLPAKFAEMQTNSPEEAIKFLEAHGIWEELPFPTQTAILDSNSTEEVANIMKDHEDWKKIPWRERQALVGTNTKETVTTATKGHATWEGQKWNDKHAKIEVTTNAQSVAAIAREAIGSVTGKTVTVKTRYETSGSAPRGIGAYATRNAKGTDYHTGGLTWLGDGGKHEPWLTPAGEFGISPDDWTLYDLPKGTKVWPSIEKLNSEIPRFATGTSQSDISNTNLMSLMSRLKGNESRPTPVRESETVSESSYQAVISQLIKGQEAIVKALSQIMSSQGKPFIFQVGYSEIARGVVPIVDKQIGQNIEDAEGRLIL